MVTGISLALMTVGLYREDLLFDTATFGPIVIFNLGVCIQAYSIVHHHQLGVQLDSIVFSRFQIKENEEKWAGFILTCFFAILGTLFAGWSIIAITDSSGTKFALLLFISSISYGIVLGRINYWLRALGTPQPEQTKHWSMLDELGKKSEIADMDLFVRGLDCKSPNGHRKTIAAQRAKLTEEMNELIFSDVRLDKLLSNFLTKNKNNHLEVNIQMIFVELNPGQDQWFRETRDYWKTKGNFQAVSNLEALVLLPALSNLAKSICLRTIDPLEISDHENTIIFDKLLEKLGFLATVLRSKNLYLSSPNSIEIVDFEPDLRHRSFILDMASRLYSPDNEELSWSPWWLIDLRYRMQLLQSQQDWNQMGPLVNLKDDKISYYLYGFASLLVSGGDLKSDSSQIQNDIVEAIKNHPNSYVREHFPKRSFFNKLRNQVTPSINPIDNVLKMAWVVWLTLHEKK